VLGLLALAVWADAVCHTQPVFRAQSPERDHGDYLFMVLICGRADVGLVARAVGRTCRIAYCGAKTGTMGSPPFAEDDGPCLPRRILPYPVHSRATAESF